MYEKLSSRAVIGLLLPRLEQAVGASWVGRISNMFQSDQAVETYPWLGQVPAFREWAGGRQIKSLRDFDLEIRNKLYEATLGINVDDLRRDKTDQLFTRIDELGERAVAHWASLLSSLLVGAWASPGYDGQYFFDTDHSEGDSGSQSNMVSVDVTTPATPTAGEFEGAILAGIEQMFTLKDDQGEPINENAAEFLVMVPVKYLSKGLAALRSEVIVEAGTSRTNTILASSGMSGWKIDLAVNPRLSYSESRFAIFRTDSAVKPLIRQQETEPDVSVLDEESDHAFKNREVLYGIESWRGAGYSRWQGAVSVTLT